MIELTRDVWPFTQRRLDIDGATIHYTDEGDGPVLLFVHAGLWSFVWRDAIVRLRSDFRCVSLDFPGQGCSADGPTSIAAHTAVLDGLVGAVGLDDVTVVAHDLGGPVGFGWAARNPDATRALVAVNTFAWPPHGAMFKGMLRTMGSRPVRALDVATNLLFRATSTRFGVGRHFDKHDRRAFLAPFRARGPRRAFHDMLRDASRSRVLLGELETALGSVLSGKPMLTIFGQRNDPMRFQPRWKALFPDATQVVVPKGLHFPMCDDPDLFADALRSWYARAVAPRAKRSTR
jgi:pimeloyl-ACP methyl ester carboxylesterase